MHRQHLSGRDLKSLKRLIKKKGGLLSIISQDANGVFIIPEWVEDIPEGAFAGLEDLHEIKLPSSLKSIGRGAFKKCIGLKRIEIPEGVTRIPDDCFNSCENLEEVILSEGVKEIGIWAFERCYSLSKINLPKSLEVIGAWAFDLCKNLSFIEIGTNIKMIGEGAFQSGCIGTLRLGAFAEPVSLKGVVFFNTPIHSIVVDPNSLLYEDANCNVIMEKETGKLICGSVNSIIPEKATSIEEDAFGASPKFIVIPSSVKRIKQYAFSGRESTFIIKNGVEVLEEYAFRPIFWTEDNEVYIPASVHTIEGQNSSVKFHLDAANQFFYYDSNGDNIISYDGKLVWGHLREGIPSQGVKEVHVFIDGSLDYSELTIPEGVNYVGPGIFGIDYSPFDRVIVHKGTKIGFPDDYETESEIKLVVSTPPSPSGITKTLEYIIPSGTFGREISNFLGDDTI